MVTGYPTEREVPIRFVLMKRRMFFKIGVTLIIFVGILLFFIIDVEDNDRTLFYQRIPVERGSVYLMEMALVDQAQDDSPLEAVIGVANDNGLESRESINAQIDEEQNELLAHRQKLSRGNGDHAARKEESDSAKQDFYYDNSIPDPDRLTKKKKKIDIFDPKDQRPVLSRDFTSPGSHKTVVHLCVVVCENRAVEALTMLKSAAIVTNDVALVFHIVADKERQPIIQAELDSWPSHFHHYISYHVYDVAFPHSAVTLTAWNKLYKPCASQRLFLPDRFTSVESLIYVDTDTVFLQSVSSLWSFFRNFNSSQLVGLVRESEDGTAGWYNRFANHPYYGDYGVNSGVMLMNLTRIRRGTNWLSVLQEDYEKYRLAMTWGDQDLINIYLAKRPDQAFVMPCNWNYRSDHCMYTSNCRSAEEKGVSLVHASRGAFYSEAEPVFGAVFQAFQHVSFGPEQVTSLVSDLESRFKHTSSEVSSCSDVTSLFLTQLVKLAVVQQSDQSVLPRDSHKDLPSNVLLQVQDSKMDKQVDSSSVNKGQLKFKLNIRDNLDLESRDFKKGRSVSLQGNHIHSERFVSKTKEKSGSILNNNNNDNKVVGESGLNDVDRGMKKVNLVDTNDLTHNEVYINNKLKTGSIKNVMTGERDVFKSLEKKSLHRGVIGSRVQSKKSEVKIGRGGGDGDIRNKVEREVARNMDTSNTLAGS